MATAAKEKEMLSPDVPEFVPREVHNLNTTAGVGCIEHTGRTHTPHSEYHDYHSNHGVYDSGNWRSQPVHTSQSRKNSPVINRFKRGQEDYKLFNSPSNTSWRNTGRDDQNTRFPVRSKDGMKETSGKSSLHNTSTKERQSWREKPSQAETGDYPQTRPQGVARYDHREGYKKQIWRDKSSQGNNGMHRHATQPPFTNRDPRFVNKYNSTSEIKHTQNDASRNAQGFAANRIEASRSSNATINSPKRNRGTKIERLDLPIRFTDKQQNVSYKKVLSRRSVGEVLAERAETHKSDTLLQSKEQWPSLSGTYSQNSSGNAVNVWMKNDSQDSSSWSRPGLTSPTPSSASVPNVISSINGDVTENRKVDDQGNDEATKENVFNSKVAKKAYKKSKKGEGSILNDSRNLQESSKCSKSQNVFNGGNSPGDNVSSSNNTVNEKSEFKTDSPFASQDDDLLQWQVQKKKKNKVKENLEQGAKSSDRNNSSNKEIKVNKKDYLENTYSKSSKHGKTGKANQGPRDKLMQNPSKDDSAHSYGDGKEKFRASINENPGKMNNRSKVKNIEGIVQPANKFTRGESKEVVSSNRTSEDTAASLSIQNTLEIDDGALQRPSVSVVPKIPPVKDAKAKKASVERKARVRAEKMRQRESKIKEAQAQLKADSKVTMVSKEILELMYGNSQNSASSKKANYTEQSWRYEDASHYSCEDYPSLKNHRKIKVTKFVASSVEDEGCVPHESASEDDHEWDTTDDNAGFDSSSRRRKASNTISTFSSENDSDNRNIRNNGEGTLATSILESVPSYSKALLTAASKTVPKKKASPEKNVLLTQVSPQITPQKKKVKTRDEMTFNLLDAVAKKVKKKELTGPKYQQPKVITQDIIDFDPVMMAAKERIQERSRSLLYALDKTMAHEPWERKQYTRRNLLAAFDGKNKPRKEVVAKRGKQREGEKKKKVSTLKKAMKRAKQQEIENLLFVLQEAKKLQGSPTSLEDSANCASPVGTSEEVDSKPEATSDAEQNLTGEEVNTENLESVNTCAVEEKMIAKTGISNLAKSVNTASDKVSLLNEMNLDSDNYEKITHNSNVKEELKQIANDINSKEEFKHLIGSDFSEKCKKIVEDMEILDNSVHKNSFREYCNHMITPETDVAAKELLKVIVSLQDNHYKRDPMKARMRRRLVCGIRSTQKAMTKLSCIIVAPDIKRCKGPGALDEVVEKMLDQAESHCVPVIFALTCKKIGQLCRKKVNVSCVGIINYHGAQVIFQKLMEMLPEAKAQYQERVARGFCSVPVGDEPSDDESLAVQETVNAVNSSNVNKESEQNDRDKIIASTVAILNEPYNKGAVSIVEETASFGESLRVQLAGPREEKVVSVSPGETLYSTIPLNKELIDAIPSKGESVS